MLNICICFVDSSGRYYRNALVTMLSVFENTSSEICAHIFCDESVTSEKRNCFIEVAERYNQTVLFYPMQNISESVMGNVSERFGKGSIFRLYIPELIAEDWVLYLDCDIICTTDIKDLFAVDMGDACLAGVIDLLDMDLKHKQIIGAEQGTYINSGVLMMNIKKIRENHTDFRDIILTIIAENKFHYPDQDAINRYFSSYAHSVFTFPEKYNFCLSIEDRAYFSLSEYHDKILHYTGDKPWQTLYPAAIVYWKYYARYFSSDEMFSSMETLQEPEFMYLYKFMLRKPKFRRMFKRFYEVYENGFGTTILDRVFPSRKKNRRRGQA